MARTKINLTDVKDTYVNLTDSFTTINSSLVSAGLEILEAFQNVDDSLALIVSNASEDTAYDVTVVKGTGIRAGSGSGVGNLVVEVPFGEQVIIPLNDSDRFAQTNGSVYVNFETGLTGTIAAIAKLPELYTLPSTT